MKKSLALILNGFQSSSTTTPEFKAFYRTFKSEFTKELQSVGATDIQFNRGHFYVSGFCTINGQVWYFNLPDVRDLGFTIQINSDSCMSKLMYRTAKSYKDYTGGQNRYAEIKTGMGENMFWSFKLID